MPRTDRVLVVDDGPAVLDVVSKIVQSLGHEVVKATNGREALEKLRNEFSSISILITDIRMPEMDGLELIKIIRSQYPHIYIICMTAHGASYTYTDVIEVGAMDFIMKPFTMNEMKAKLNRAIRDKNLIGELTKKSHELEKTIEDLKRLDQFKSDFVCGISEELQAALAAFRELVPPALRKEIGSLTEKQKECVRLGDKSVIRMATQLQKLFDFFAIEAGKELKLNLKPARLIEVVDDAITILSQPSAEKEILVENRVDPDLPEVLVDRDRMVVAFVSLIENGIRFTPPGGRVTLTSRRPTEDRDHVEIGVSDTGVGISPEDLPKIFGRFYQGRRTQEGFVKGTGMGLTIAKEIIRSHQGAIVAESKGESGTSFTLTLPLFEINAISNLLISPMLEEAERDSRPLSLIQVMLWDPQARQEIVFSGDFLEKAEEAIQEMIPSTGRVVPFQRNNILILTFSDKRQSKEISRRLEEELIRVGPIPKKTEVFFKSFSFPEEALTQDDFLEACRLMLIEGHPADDVGFSKVVFETE